MARALKTAPAGNGAPAGAAAALVRPVLVRAGGAVAVLWGAATATFVLLRIMPGSTADVLLARSTVSPEIRARLIADYRLDDGLGAQYAAYLSRLVRGDFGESHVLRRPVTEVLAVQVPHTLALLGTTTAVTVGASLVLAVISARAGRLVRGAFAAVEALLVAVPPFWLGLILLSAFSFTLPLFPAVGSSSPSGLVLPTIALAAGPVALITGVLRESMLRALDEPFVLTARTRGISETAVQVRHVLRHAVLPAAGLLGWVGGTLLGGAVIIEIVFSRQGVGRLVLSAVQNKDLPVVVAVVLLSAVVFVLFTMLVDVLTWLADPRTRTEAL
ncbi:ABC transporter permease [Actinocorallia sp. A-T 12471]|uniref:ABC transporter permease n=1 Tax=Actinocorallia sp. A-T 12471 TaxID=3089813 RepID=UPI0029CDC21B|nr:ABC transporter permease [Actinocorallia sp. A-T 12471]MDX6742188.1 ABC transporter permease [Actinocorallia sp. A-T 12471]